MDIIKAKEDFEITKSIFDRYDIKFIALYGTCLGIIRDNGFIFYDDDIDMGVFDEASMEIRDDIDNSFVKKGFEDISKSKDIRYYKRNIKIEIYWFSKIQDGYLVKNCYGTPIFINKKYIENPIMKNLYGMNVLVPNYTEEYLMKCYGNDWKYPNRNKKGEREIR